MVKMTTLRNFVALGATAAIVAAGYNAFAQDDLDDLLNDLGGEVQTPKKADAKDEKPAEVKPADAKPADAAPAKEATPTVQEPAKEKPADEKPAEVKSGEAKADGVINLLDQLDAEASSEEKPADSKAAEAKPADDGRSPEDAQLIDTLKKTQELRFKAFKLQAENEIKEAELCMKNEEFQEAARHYALAMKLLNASPTLAGLRKTCQLGVAEGLYRAALQEDATGRRDRALMLIQKAIDCRHPKARSQHEAWVAEGDPNANKTDISEIRHRRNEDEYKTRRAEFNKRLKRSQQFLAVRDLDRALDECELVLDADPYNQEAIKLREKIQNKRKTILGSERSVTRAGMIADVDETWRPVYAVDVRDVEVVADTTKKPSADDVDAASQEQSIIKRMKEMRLPAISFRPPATFTDAIEFFRQASKDYDRPDIPLEQRGFNFYFKPHTPAQANTANQSGQEDGGGFGEDTATDTATAANGDGPVVPIITASDISFYDALKLVCESVEYKFTVKGPIVTIMHKSVTIAEMHTRSFPVLSSFMERMDTAQSDIQDLRAGGGGGFLGAGNNGGNGNAEGGEENKEQDWKEFFRLMGVEWPEGSSIMYIRTLGKLRVKNTLENLAELENALNEMNMNPTLIEIETRFVEVCQDDLNSLGFEWILNSDYTLGLGDRASKVLGIKNGQWNVAQKGSSDNDGASTGALGAWGGGVNNPGTTTTPSTSASYASSKGASWIRGSGAKGNIGFGATGSDTGYSTNNRYLSTLGNHISGEGYSTNDQFMRMNAFLGSADLSMILHMLSQRSDTDLLSAPKVLTRSAEQAVIKVVTEYIYPTDYDVQLQSSSSSSGGYGNSSSAVLAIVEPSQFTMREVGVILDVTPTLTDNGNLIDLQLITQVVDEPTWKNYGMRIPFTGNSSLESFEGIGGIFEGLTGILDSIGGGLSPQSKEDFATRAVQSATSALDSLSSSSSENITYYDAPMEQPFFHVRSIDSKVSVYPGATIVMGGLITEQRKAMDDKVPFLGDIPFLGRFFRSHSERSSKRNLLIFVTTRLVDAHGREVKITTHNDSASAAEVKSAPDKE